MEKIQPTTAKPADCSICGTTYTGFGNNAWPVNDGRCCDLCNVIVVNARLAQLAKQRQG
jgi:hypothetical protein